MLIRRSTNSCSMRFLEDMNGYCSMLGDFGGGYYWNNGADLRGTVVNIVEECSSDLELHRISFLIAQPLQTTAMSELMNLEKLGFKDAIPFGRNGKYLHADALYVARGYEVLAAILRLLEEGAFKLPPNKLDLLEEWRRDFNNFPRGTFMDLFVEHEEGSEDLDDDNELTAGSKEVSDWAEEYILPTISSEGILE